MKIFVYCGEGIGYICDNTDEVDLEDFPYSYIIDNKENSEEIK